MFHPLSRIYAKTLFSCIKTVAKKTLNCQCIVVFDQLWANAAPTWNTAFPLTNIHAEWWIHCLLKSSTPLTQLQFMISQNEFVEFFCVFWNNCRIQVTWAFGIICGYTTAFKVSIPPLNYYFQQSSVQITLIKSLLCLNSIFFWSESNALSTHKIQIFPLFWKFATVTSLK